MQPWLPPGESIHILVTTRRRNLSKYSRLSLDFLTKKEGLELLNSGERNFGVEAEVIVETVGGLPLALELIRNFLNLRTTLSIDDLLKEIKNTGTMRSLDIFAKKYADDLPSGHVKEVAATFQLSWDISSSRARRLLHCMSLLAPAPVPRRLLGNILNFPSQGGLENPLGETISELVSSLSFLELDDDSNPWMHRLISGFVKITVKENEELYEDVAKAVRNEMARVTDEEDVLSFRELEKVLPHADDLLSSERIQPEHAIDISNYLRWHYRSWGKYLLAERYGLKSLDLAEKNFEPGHPTIAISQSNLALVLKDLGDLKGAIIGDVIYYLHIIHNLICIHENLNLRGSYAKTSATGCSRYSAPCHDKRH